MSIILVHKSIYSNIEVINTANSVLIRNTTDLLKYSEKWLFGIFIIIQLKKLYLFYKIYIYLN